MSYYTPTISRPKVYDPDLARRLAEDQEQTEIEWSNNDRELASLAERITESQNRTLMRELGLSDDEEDLLEDTEEAKECESQGNELDASERVALREELEQLQQRYLALLKDVHEMGERERKAIDQVSTIKRLSKSQIAILKNKYKEKLVVQGKLVEEVLDQLEEREVEAGADHSEAASFRKLHKKQQLQFLENSDVVSNEATSVCNAGDMVAVQKQNESLREENALLQNCLRQVAGGQMPFKVSSSQSMEVPQVEQVGSPRDEVSNAYAHKLNSLSPDTLRSKLVKALKIAKHAQHKLSEKEKESQSLLQLLNEAKLELERRGSASLAVPAPPPVPAKASKRFSRPNPPLPAGEKPASKTEQIKAKFENLKSRLDQKEKECEHAHEQIKALKHDLASLQEAQRSSSQLNEQQDQTESYRRALELEKGKVAKLEKALQSEGKRGKAVQSRSNARFQQMAKQLRHLQMRLAEEKHAVHNTRRELKDLVEHCQRDTFALVSRLESRIHKERQAMSGVIQKYQRECKERKRLFNLVQELRGNIRVLCRVRPALPSEASEVITRFPEEGAVAITNANGREQSWEFDHVFQPGASNEQVFAHVSDLCTSILDGYNVCIFAYGQTGSGKTYTMEGVPNDRGVNYRALKLLFERMRERSSGHEWTFQTQVSLLEIYNEQIRDLLSSDKRQQKKLEVKASKFGMHVPGLTMVSVANEDQVIKLMDLGKKNRTTASTQMNADSSRSHSMLSTYIVATNNITKEQVRGKLHLIDLAGSERISKSKVKGAQLTEATNINKSLSSLGDVIQARANKQGHVPYRNSTLTYLLQDSLSANSKTFMFVQVSPVTFNMSESICSLNFAARARTVELGKASKNVSK